MLDSIILNATIIHFGYIALIRYPLCDRSMQISLQSCSNYATQEPLGRDFGLVICIKAKCSMTGEELWRTIT